MQNLKAALLQESLFCNQTSLAISKSLILKEMAKGGNTHCF